MPFKPGGRTDTVARLMGEKIQADGLLSQPMVVVNADGGAGANAVNRMRRGDADGHTIVHWHHQALIAMAMELGDFSLDDFKAIGYTGGGSPVWVVKSDSEFQTLEDVIAHLKENPRGLVEAVGIGTIPHFVGAMLAKEAGFETRYVTANSGADRLRLILGGIRSMPTSLSSPHRNTWPRVKACAPSSTSVKSACLRFRMFRPQWSLATMSLGPIQTGGWLRRPHLMRMSPSLQKPLKRRSTIRRSSTTSTTTRFSRIGRLVRTL